jgi:hypothetical protein
MKINDKVKPHYRVLQNHLSGETELTRSPVKFIGH